MDGAKMDAAKSELKPNVVQFPMKHPEIQIASTYVDDGYSGVDFERPEFQRMLSDIRENKINCVVVKDLSRFGRNYIESGRYIEKIFPMLGIRFIAITDGYDSINEDMGSEMIIPFKNLINDAYCRDISVKIRSHMDIKRRNGEYIGAFAAYGYLKDEENKNHLVIDDYAADVVRDIFTMKLCGMSQQAIADKLNIPCSEFSIRVRWQILKAAFLLLKLRGMGFLQMDPVSRNGLRILKNIKAWHE